MPGLKTRLGMLVAAVGGGLVAFVGMNVIDLKDELPSDGDYPFRPLKDVDTIIIHHTANERTVEGNADYHVNYRDWQRIGYHYVIGKSQTDPNKLVIVQTNDIDRRTNHASGWNNRSIGVAVTGNFDLRAPTETEFDLLVHLVSSLEMTHDVKQIIGHRDTKATACPGENLYPIIEELNCLLGNEGCDL